MKSTPAIMHVILVPRYSGAEIIVRDLSILQREMGCPVSITALAPSQETFVPEMEGLERAGCRLFVPPEPLKGFARARWISQSIAEAKPQVVIAHSALPSLYTRLALRFRSAPVVITVLHADDDFKDRKILFAERFLWSRNATLVGVSDASLTNYRRRVTHKVRTEVIRNGIRLKEFRQETGNREEARRRLFGSNDKETILLQVGRIALQKQQHVSVEALGILRKRGMDNLRLYMAGLTENEDYKERVIAAARAGGVLDRIEFMGPRGDIPELLAAADLYLMPSGWEAHSVAALEALASGIVCIFSGIGAFSGLSAFPGVSIIGREPVSADLASALERALEGLSDHPRYSRDLSGYSLERCAEQYMTLASQVLGRAESSRSGTAFGGTVS